MNTATNSKQITSLLWVEVTPPDQPKYWGRTTRLLASASEEERRNTIDLLKAGKRIVYTQSDLSIQCVPMPLQDQKRLDHLRNFERNGFFLVAFRMDTALFARGAQQYVSMNEMIERDFVPTCSIAVSQWNVAIVDKGRRLIDVFVPVEFGSIYFLDSSFYGF
jgi:hypothetical protein